MYFNSSPRAKTRNDIFAFLSENSNNWFSPKEVALGIGQEGKSIVNQLDSLLRVHEKIHLDIVWITSKQKRLFYGYFETKEQAIATPSKLKRWRWRSISGN